MLIRIAWLSLLNRKGSVLLTLLAVMLSVFVLLGIEHVRQQAKASFASTISGVDLIVGARTGDINLLLYSVFRLGNATNNIDWNTYQAIAADPLVAWTIPISLGDSHRGYRVMGTNADYFRHFQYGVKQPLIFAQGQPFTQLFDVVLGAEVAKRLHYSLGDKLVLAHGMASTSFSKHDKNPFTVSGILAPTGTPVDQTLHVSVEAIEAIHVDFGTGTGVKAHEGVVVANDLQHDLTPKSITAFMVGLKSRMDTFHLQRQINEFSNEPLLAILPGVTLSQLWGMLAVMEDTLRLVSALVLLAALLGMSAMLLASIRERRREIVVLRMIGASPWHLFVLIELEALLITITAVACALLLLWLSIVAAGNWLAQSFGLFISANVLEGNSLLVLLVVIVTSIVASAIPAAGAYFSKQVAN